MSGDKVLRLELESKKRCDDVKFMKRIVGNIVNDAKITESLEKISYSCCSSSCCNYNTTNTATTDAMDIKSTTKMSDNVKIMTKTSEATGNHYLSSSICCTSYCGVFCIMWNKLFYFLKCILCKISHYKVNIL